MLSHNCQELHLQYANLDVHDCSTGNKPKNAALFTKSGMESLPGLLKWNNLFLVFSWSAITAVKMSFLAIFWILIRDVSRRLVHLWWFVVVITILSWLFNILRNPIDCGWEKGKLALQCPVILANLAGPAPLLMSQRMYSSFLFLFFSFANLRYYSHRSFASWPFCA